MKEQKKLEQLFCAFPRLTEINQVFVLGLAEGLIYTQGKKKGKIVGKMKDRVIEIKEVQK